MWHHYRKTFIPTQILIVVICILLTAIWKVPPRALVVYLLIMEFFTFAGALWAVSLKKRIIRSQGSLPDEKR
jgi:hypothetical protein